LFDVLCALASGCTVTGQGVSLHAIISSRVEVNSCAKPWSDVLAATGKEVRLVLVGPPASGKGTAAADIMKERQGVCHVAIGDLLRAAAATDTPLGRKIKPILERGELVPDEVTLSLLKEHLGSPACQGGFILDGFPRSLSQAQQLDAVLGEANQSLDGVIQFKVPDSVLEERMAGRRIHPASGRIYHVTWRPPHCPGKDDVTGDPLVQRSDDTPEALKRRLAVYRSQTKPVVEYYAEQGLLHLYRAG